MILFNEDEKWQIGKLTCYTCNRLDLNHENFKWENEIYWEDISMEDDIINLSYESLI